MTRRVTALALWGYAAWVLLTWTATAEQLLVGAGVALVFALLLAPVGDVVAPWSLFRPHRLAAATALVGVALGRIVRSNLSLARRIWAPARPLASGMVVIPTMLRRDGTLGPLGLISSLIVDNQVVDVDRAHNSLQYHCIDVPGGSADDRAAAILEPMQRLVHEVAR